MPMACRSAICCRAGPAVCSLPSRAMRVASLKAPAAAPQTSRAKITKRATRFTPHLASLGSGRRSWKHTQDGTRSLGQHEKCHSPKSDDLWPNSCLPLLSMSLCKVLRESRPPDCCRGGVPLPTAAPDSPPSSPPEPSFCFKTSVLWASFRDDPGDPLGCSLFFLQENQQSHYMVEIPYGTMTVLRSILAILNEH